MQFDSTRKVPSTIYASPRMYNSVVISHFERNEQHGKQFPMHFYSYIANRRHRSAQTRDQTDLSAAPFWTAN